MNATDAFVGRKTLRGVVVSDKMDKSIVVRSERMVLHPKYKKYIRRFTKYYAHDEKNEAKTGDIVEISMTHPLSKLKRWRLAEILVKGRGALEHAEEPGGGRQ